MGLLKLVSTEKLIFGHSLVSNTCAKGVTLEQYHKIAVTAKKEVENFGLFDSATPNFATYYPDVTAADLQPKDEDFVFPIFRALSEVLVRPGAPIDFSLDGILKASMKKLVGQTVFPNHEQAVGNELGSVLDVEWQDDYNVGSLVVPAGINSRLKIDGKSNPKTARSIMMSPPSIHSTSVTVEFEWEKSHNISDEEFYNKLGSKDEKGLIYKRNVTKVRNYHEISLVSHGADAFAQRVGEDGKIVNPKYAGNVYRFNAEDEPGKGSKQHFFNYKETESFSLTPSTIPDHSNNNQQETLEQEPMKNILLQFLMLTGVVKATAEAQVEKLTDDESKALLLTFIGDAKKDKEEVTRLTTLVSDKDTEIGKLTTASTEKDTQITGLTEKAKLGEIGEKALTKLKNEATKYYTLSAGDKPEQAVIDLIAKGDFATVEVLHKQYAKTAEDSFKLSCKDCNSTNISRMSAEGGENNDTSEPIDKSNDDVMLSLTKEKRTTKLFGK